MTPEIKVSKPITSSPYSARKEFRLRGVPRLALALSHLYSQLLRYILSCMKMRRMTKEETHYSKGFVRVPHQVRNIERPTVSRTLATRLTPTVSSGRFSMRISLKKVGALLAAKMSAPR